MHDRLRKFVYFGLPLICSVACPFTWCDVILIFKLVELELTGQSIDRGSDYGSMAV
jgi:hypothetical protein